MPKTDRPNLRSIVPSKDEWDEWSPFERASYVAQIIVPISLLVTVVFSFLSWREARLAQQMQRDLFLAQSSPRIDIIDVELARLEDFEYMVITVANNGGSTAENFCFATEFEPLDESSISVSTSCERSSSEPKKDGVPPGSTTRAASPITNLMRITGFDAKSAHYVGFPANLDVCEPLAIFRAKLLITYEDAFGNSYDNERAITFCGEETLKDTVEGEAASTETDE